MNRIFKLIFSLTDLNTYVALHRKFFFRFVCQIGKGVKFTHRVEIFRHGVGKNSITLGDFVVLDGTLEVYESGSLVIGDYSYIGRSRIFCSNQVTVGRYCLISDGVCVMDSDLHPLSARGRAEISERWANGVFPDVYTDVKSAEVTLEDHCWIGFGSAILKGVTVGEGAIVGANSVVTTDIPPWTIAAGNPAKVIRMIENDGR